MFGKVGVGLPIAKSTRNVAPSILAVLKLFQDSKTRRKRNSYQALVRQLGTNWVWDLEGSGFPFLTIKFRTYTRIDTSWVD